MRGWASLPAWFRIPVSLLVMAIGVFFFYASKEGETPRGKRRAMIIGMLTIGAGGWLLLRGPSESEKKGYDF